MLFGRSVFQSILTRLDSEEEERATPSPAAQTDLRINGLNAGFVLENISHASAAQAADAYLDFGADDAVFEEMKTEHTSEPPLESMPPQNEPEAPPAPVIPTPAIPTHLLRLTEAEIAEDLGLSPRDTPYTAHEKRRRFAKTNHPDQVAPQFHQEATRRMTIANTLVDRFLKTMPLR